MLRLAGEVVAVGALALLGRGEGVVVSVQPAVRLGAELGLEGGELLRDAQEAAHFHAQDHPNDICGREEPVVSNTVVANRFHRKMVAVELFFHNRKPSGPLSG